jgi:hypothetical protein
MGAMLQMGRDVRQAFTWGTAAPGHATRVALRAADHPAAATKSIMRRWRAATVGDIATLEIEILPRRL